MVMHYDYVNTTLGTIFIVATDLGLRKIGYPEQSRVAADWISRNSDQLFIKGNSKLLEESKLQLIAYTKGILRQFDVPLDVEGTVFQKKVWMQLANIHYGSTVTYKDIACTIEGERYARAVGTAVARNPLPFVLPCHRVVGKRGQLTGYAGGIELKKQLLLMEQVLLK